MPSPDARDDHDELLGQLGWMRALALRLVQDPDVADDVLQRACLLALQQAPERRHTGYRLRAWLAAVTAQLVGHAWRSEHRRSRRERVAARPEALPATVDLAARREILRQLVQAVTALDEPYFSTLVRRYYEGLSSTEIAAQDGITPDAVRQRLSRARRELRERLDSGLRAEWLLPLGLPTPSSHHALRGLVMAEHSARPLVLKAVAATLVATLGITAWLSTESASDPGVSTSPPVVGPEVARTSPARSPLQGLPSVEQAAAEPLDPAPASSASPSAARMPAVVYTAVPVETTWKQLWATTDATVSGQVALADVLAASESLLAILEGQAASDPVAGASALQPLFEVPGLGKASFKATSGTDEEQRPYKAYAFDVELDTRSGYCTGVQQGADETTTLSMVYSLDEHGAPRSCGTVVQNMPRYGAELHAQLRDQAPTTIGGNLAVSEDASSWAPITLQAIPEGVDNPAGGGPAGPGCFLFRTGERVAKSDSLTDPRLSAFSQRLTALPVATGH